jgi:hypothetical protein
MSIRVIGEVSHYGKRHGRGSKSSKSHSKKSKKSYGY